MANRNQDRASYSASLFWGMLAVGGIFIGAAAVLAAYLMPSQAWANETHTRVSLQGAV